MENLTLSSVLNFADGRPVTSSLWPERRREIYPLVIGTEYGFLPPPAAVTAMPVHSTEMKKLFHLDSFMLTFATPQPSRMMLNIYRPLACRTYPVIINGDGCWLYATEQIPFIIERGYALASFNRLELAADVIDGNSHDRYAYGLYASYPADFGALAAWAWGYHRVVDFLLTLPWVEQEHIGICGHSRGGKTVLLAAATDERIKLTGANGSGCGGAGSFKIRSEGCEDLARILSHFPYWFAPGLQDWVGKELPFDQHFLTALIAPRALITTEAADDIWANPAGSRAIYEAGQEVYRLLGAEDRLAAHTRPGGHAHIREDFAAMFDFADYCFAKE